MTGPATYTPTVPATTPASTASPAKGKSSGKDNKSSTSSSNTQIDDEPFLEEIKKKSRLLDQELANFKAENEVCDIIDV